MGLNFSDDVVDHESSCESLEVDSRLKKLNFLKEQGVDPFVSTSNRTHVVQDVLTYFETHSNLEDCSDEFTLSGRLMSKRLHGKAFFGDLLDDSGRIQVYANVKLIGQELFDLLASFDVGDIVECYGIPFLTRRGELTLKLNSIQLLTKSLLPLPEKYHGLQDKELRFRKRYLDLIMNQDVKTVFKQRSLIIKLIRNFLDQRSFLEVETPVLQHIYGGAAAKPFKTFHHQLGQDLYLRIALELHHKRLIVGGFERIFEIGRVFRNEGVSFKHNPEYTLLELYQAYADYQDMMELTESLVCLLVQEMFGSDEISIGGQVLSFKRPFKRLSLSDAVSETLHVDVHNEAALRSKVDQLGIQLPKGASKGYLISELYDFAVEPTLIQPTFIVDHPWEISPLAKRKKNNDQLVDRFELIINKMEIANAFSELNDPIDQKSRFEDQLKAKSAGWADAHEMDLDFIEALKYGMPPTGGLGIGIDRLVMLLTSSSSIRDVLLFPHLKQ